MLRFAAHLTLLLLFAGKAMSTGQCSAERASSLQFVVKTARNQTGYRVTTVDFQTETNLDNETSVAVDHWTTVCGHTRTVAFSVVAVVPASETELEANVTTPPAPKSPAPAPPGYEHIPNVGHYKFLETAVPWTKGRAACEQEGAQLAVPDTQQEWDALIEMQKRKSNPGWASWLGIQKEDNQWKTIQGRRVNSSDIRWRSGELDKGDYLTLYYDGIQGWEPSTVTHSLCEWPIQ